MNRRADATSRKVSLTVSDQAPGLEVCLLRWMPSSGFVVAPAAMLPVSLWSDAWVCFWCRPCQAFSGLCRKLLLGSLPSCTRSASMIFLTASVRNRIASESAQNSIWEVVSWNGDFMTAFCSPAIENLTAPSCPHSRSESRNAKSSAIVRSGHCAHIDTSKNKSSYSIKKDYTVSTKLVTINAVFFRFDPVLVYKR